MNRKVIDSRRVFVNKGEEYFQIFSFSQPEDGSIYCAMPEFAEIEWMHLTMDNNQVKLEIVDPLKEDGKISFHGSGMVAYRPHADAKGHRMIIKGHHLKSRNDDAFRGVRHLISCFVQEPNFKSEKSPAKNRASDYVLTSLIDLKPFVVILFAIPSKQDLKVKFNVAFHEDDVSIPPDLSYGNFDLRFHNVMWIIYRTNNMDKWPTNTKAIYFDGYHVPMFIGKSQNATDKTGQMALEIRRPIYRLEENTLFIEIPR